MSETTSPSLAPAAHRAPGRRPFLTADWRWLIIASWQVDPARLRPFIPYGLELDCFAGQTYVSLVGFVFQDARLCGVSIPFHSCFPEVNLRYYVAREVAGERRRGVIFVKELVPRRAVSWIARIFYNENYATLPMRYSCGLKRPEVRAADEFAYEWRWRGKWNALRAVTREAVKPPAELSLNRFIAEHYWGYSKQRDGGVLEYEVEHPSWQLAELAALEVDCDFAGLYSEPFSGWLSGPPASAFVADGSAVAVYPGRRI